MSELKNKFDELVEQQRELAKKFQETAQSLFKETTKEFFDNNPAVKAVVWTQYTPFFNDGEVCVFRVNDPTFTNAEGEDLNEVSPYGEYEGDNEKVWAIEAWSLKNLYDESRDWLEGTRQAIKESGSVINIELCNQFEKMITSIDFEDVMRAMFGDHVKVIATKDGFDVEEYDHD